MKPISPIHFFNHFGDSVLSVDHLSKQLAEKDTEIEELKRRVRSLTMRLQAIAGEDKAKTINS